MSQQTELFTEEQIKQGWRDTFSTENPFCPCDLKSFIKTVRWAERRFSTDFAAFQAGRASLPASDWNEAIDLPWFVNGVREFVLGQLHGNLAIEFYDSVRAVDPAWLANTVLESQKQPLSTAPQVYIGETDLSYFHRFCDCCEDSDADGHDVPKEIMKRLCDIGLVRSAGFGRHQTTRYGDAIRALKRQPSEVSAHSDHVRDGTKLIEPLNADLLYAAWLSIGADVAGLSWLDLMERYEALISQDKP